MSHLQLTLKHGRSLDEARHGLEQSVHEVCRQFGPMIERVGWSDDRNSVSLSGAGCHVEICVDPIELHVRGDIPILAGLLGGSVIYGLKQIIGRNFHQQLTDQRKTGGPAR